MRVLFLSHDFLPHHAAGTELYSGHLARRLRERGHDVRVFTTEKDIGRVHLSVTRREWEGVPVYELVNNHFYQDFAETWDWPAARESFARVLEEFRPDVVHAMHLLYLSIGCLEEAASRGIPIVYTLHDFWLQCARFGQRIHADGEVCHTIDHDRCGSCLVSLKFAQTKTQERAARWIAGLRSRTGVNLAGAALGVQELVARRARSEPSESPFAAPPREAAEAMRARVLERDQSLRERLVPLVHRFFAPSRFLRERFLEWGIAEEQIEHLGYGLELAPFEGFAREPSEVFRVSYVGTLAPHKAPHVLLEAWGLLEESLRERARLRVHGPKRHNPGYGAGREGLAERGGAERPGELARAELGRALADTDLLVVTSVWFENSPLTIHEALATRTPLLVSDLGGMAELVEPGRHGLRFRPGDAGDLARKLGRFLEDPGFARSLDFGNEPVKSMERSAEEMERRYSEALGARTAGAREERR